MHGHMKLKFKILYNIHVWIFSVICLLKLCTPAQNLKHVGSNSTLSFVIYIFFKLFCFSVEVWFFVSTYHVLPSNYPAVLTTTCNMMVSSFVREAILSALLISSICYFCIISTFSVVSMFPYTVKLHEDIFWVNVTDWLTKLIEIFTLLGCYTAEIVS
jgi:hypothetical protein